MAKLSDLVRAVADLTGVPLSSVTIVGRVLREAGLIASKGRGRGGANMSSGDAANLLLGVITLGDTTKAAEVVQQLRLTQLARVRARRAQIRQDFTGDEARREFPAFEGAVTDVLEHTLDELKLGDGAAVEDEGYDPESEHLGDPEWRPNVGDQTPIRLEIRAEKHGAWQLALTVKLANGARLNLEFQQADEPVIAMSGSQLRMFEMHALPSAIVEGVIRCIRDQDDRKLPLEGVGR